MIAFTRIDSDASHCAQLVPSKLLSKLLDCNFRNVVPALKTVASVLLRKLGMNSFTFRMEF